ncbi:hypothetical protein, partial [Paraburkholderia sp. SIMBA_054]|uniref:hypothetical protein n=1 Tax=Paraburkholderia sp. SIMBA_054 TaxID=3085795 RepID=UPI00397B34D6
MAAAPVLAQTADKAVAPSQDIAPAADASPARANATPAQRSRADAAATATLAALLPHLASNDTIPLMDRSAMFAGD